MTASTKTFKSLTWALQLVGTQNVWLDTSGTRTRGAAYGRRKVAAASAAVVRSLIAVITTISEQIKILQGPVNVHFSQLPDAEVIRSQPGLGRVPGAWVLAEFGDGPHRYASAKARKNYADTSPIARQI
jgi:hypothetical protein